MKGTTMKKLRLFSLLAAAAILPMTMLVPATALAQGTASVHGHVQNAAGMALTTGQVKFTTDKTVEPKDRKYKNTFDIDGNGEYKGTGVTPGDYLVIVVQGDKTIDFQEVTFKAGDDKTVDFDMTRKEYIDKMSPEDKKALEDYKKRAGETINTNKVIANLNAAMKGVSADLASANPNYDQDVKTMQQATTQKADEAVLWMNLAQAQNAKADHDAKTAGKTFASDPAIVQEYNDAIVSYKKGIEVNATAKKPNPADAGIAWNAIGNADAKIGKLEDAQAAYDNGVKIAPASAGMVYGNEAAVLFNAGHGDEAAAAADKAIAADPTKPMPYYIKGQSLIAKATVDKNGKYVTPPGCIEAYQKFLELAPDSPLAPEVKAILTGMGETITTKYKAPKK
jgi:tetratricopeptide (TPR) repeat protein